MLSVPRSPLSLYQHIPDSQTHSQHNNHQYASWSSKALLYCWSEIEQWGAGYHQLSELNDVRSNTKSKIILYGSQPTKPHNFYKRTNEGYKGQMPKYKSVLDNMLARENDPMYDILTLSSASISPYSHPGDGTLCSFHRDEDRLNC